MPSLINPSTVLSYIRCERGVTYNKPLSVCFFRLYGPAVCTDDLAVQKDDPYAKLHVGNSGNCLRFSPVDKFSCDILGLELVIWYFVCSNISVGNHDFVGLQQIFY